MTLIRNKVGEVVGWQEPHQRQSPTPQRFTVYRGIWALSIFLSGFLPSRLGGDFCFSVYKWAANRHDLLFLAPPLTPQQKLENAQADTEGYAACFPKDATA